MHLCSSAGLVAVRSGIVPVCATHHAGVYLLLRACSAAFGNTTVCISALIIVFSRPHAKPIDR
jgi:hypothetical protein